MEQPAESIIERPSQSYTTESQRTKNKHTKHLKFATPSSNPVILLLLLSSH